ncbi:MAG: class I SAM-dependent methyltransferase [Solirubrobacterales bacterium]|nr:class I SAM-dependent methyltransferase [Solirubrobacterales bacterium]
MPCSPAATPVEADGRPRPVPCPLCGGATQPAFSAVDRNRGLGDGRAFHYVRCTTCSTLALANPPADLSEYYPPAYYDLPEPADLGRLASSEAHKVDLLSRYVPPGRLVEIGPGFGVFALAARRAGFEVTGIEMDPRCCRYLESNVGVAVVCSDAPANVLGGLPPSRAIALWHSLEHLPAAGQLLESAARALEPGGVLVIAMPNPEALQMRLLGARWAHVDAPRHLALIPLDALTARLALLGLRRAEAAFDDPAGRHWNRFGWEYAVRRRPSAGPAGPVARTAGALLALGLRPLERRERRGTAYTALFVKDCAA